MTLRQLCRGNVSERNRASGRAVPWAGALVGFLGMALTGCGQQPSAPPPAAPRPPLASRPPTAVKQDAERPVEPASTSAAGRRLPLYELKMAPKDLQALEQNPHSNNLHPATLIADGEVYDQVKVRYRGAYARSWPKKPLKVFFNDTKPFQGQPRLNLNSGWRDPAMIRETLAYAIYDACGAPASKSRMVRVDLNGQFRGLYVEVEQPDKAFLKRLNLKGASIYKASSRSNTADERDLGAEAAYRSHYEKETQKDESYADLQQFCQELARTTDVLDFFMRRVDLKRYIDFLAATTLTQNWDGYNKNHFIVYDGKGSKKWFAVPWDLDRTLGDHWDWSFSKADLPILLGTRQMPGVTGWNRMADRFFSHPALRAQFLDRLEELLQKEFTTEKLFPVIDRLEAQISAEAARDRQRWGGPSDVRGGIAELKRFIERRRAYLLREVPKLRRDTAAR
jgi:spore coat protein H